MAGARHKFTASKGGFIAWVSELEPHRWCTEVKDVTGMTFVVWFSTSEAEARVVLGWLGGLLRCEFRELSAAV